MSNTNEIVLSKTTRMILENFSKISSAILLQPEKVLRAADAETGTVFARAQIEEDFPFEFAIADIGQLLSVMKLTTMKDCVMKFVPQEGKNLAYILLQGSGVSVKFVAGSKLLVDLPPVEPELEEGSPDVLFDAQVTHQSLSDFKSACNTLGLTHCIMKNENGKAYLVGQNPTTDASNDYVLNLGDTSLDDCSVYVLVSVLKFIESDYRIRTNGAFLHAANTSGKIEYFISCEEI